MPSGRSVSISALGVAALMAIALAIAPASAVAKPGKAHKPLRIGAKLPAPGHASLSRVLFKLKAPGKQKKKRPKLKVRARISKRAALPKNAHLILRVRRSKKKPTTYMADLLLINSAPTGASSSAAAGESAELPPGTEVATALEFLFNGGGVVDGIPLGKVIEDSDLDQPNPSPVSRLCGGADPASFEKVLTETLTGLALAGIHGEELEELVEAAEDLFCGEALPEDPAVQQLLRAAGWIREPGASCTGSLNAAPPPDQATEFQVLFSCTQPATSVGLALPGGRVVSNYIAPSQLPQCADQAIGTGHWLFCQGGTLPANTQATVQIQPMPTQLGNCDRLSIFLNPPSAMPAGTGFQTGAFGSCP